MIQWYTIFSKPRKEQQIAAYLQSNCFEVYYPTLKVKPVNPRASKIQPYFPRYLFVNLDISECGISPLQWAPGVVGLVQFGGEPAVVPDDFINRLRQRIAQIEGAGGIHLDGLEKGDSIRITSGAFDGYDAIFDQHLSGQDRVQVLLHWMGRQMKVKINAHQIEKRRRH